MAPIFRGKEHMIIIILIYAHKIPRSMQKMQKQASAAQVRRGEMRCDDEVRRGEMRRDAMCARVAANTSTISMCAELATSSGMAWVGVHDGGGVHA